LDAILKIVVIVLGAAIVWLNDMAREAEKKAWSEQKKIQQEERDKAATAALELLERRKIEYSKALAIARAEYPQFVDEDELGERGWWEEGDKEEIIQAHLDPPDLLLKYHVLGDDQDSVVRLYERERVDRMERTSSAVIQQRGLVRARRERLEQQ